MARKALFLSLCLGLLCLAQAGDDPTETLDGVQDLTPDNFDKFVNGAKHALVEFYAPWCGHCKHMVPEYKSVGEMVANDPKLKDKVVIAKINADTHRSLGERFDVRGFPTIKWFPRGVAANKDTVKDYNGARTAPKFMEYITEQLVNDKTAAHIESLAPIASKFLTASNKAALVAEAKAEVAKLEGEAKSNGELYVSMMEKAVAKGDDYMGKEKARLEKMLQGGSIHASKVPEMARKISVLGAFVEAQADA